jgi:hypothetical protein
MNLPLSVFGGLLDWPAVNLGLDPISSPNPFKGQPSRCYLKHYNKTPRGLKIDRNIKRKEMARKSRKRNR